MVETSDQLTNVQKEEMTSLSDKHPNLNHIHFSWKKSLLSSSSKDINENQKDQIKCDLSPLPTIFLCQEFFDALPIHKFLFCSHIIQPDSLLQSTTKEEKEDHKILGENKWCEMLVDIDNDPSSPLYFSLFPSFAPSKGFLSFELILFLKFTFPSF